MVGGRAGGQGGTFSGAPSTWAYMKGASSLSFAAFACRLSSALSPFLSSRCASRWAAIAVKSQSARSFTGFPASLFFSSGRQLAMKLRWNASFLT